MRFFTFFLIYLFSLQVALGITLDERRIQIVKIIDEELSEVSRLAKQSGNRNPDHLLRMAELYLEKARLWREKENQDYVALPDSVRRKTDKKKYFSTSASYFNAANKICLKITKSFKSYSGINDVYYILGFNAKEAGQMKTAQKYFSLANSKSSSKSMTKVKSQISLAEIHYNNKRYTKATPLYEDALSRYKDKWWTKDSFNLAWCYFRTNKYSQAISKMQEVFKLSSDNKYVDMRSSVERDIGLFFATAGRIDEGIDFYKKIGINFTDQLLRIAVTMKGRGQFSLADKTLKYALQYEKNQNRFAEIYIEQLDLFDKFGKVPSHYKTAEQLYLLFQKGALTNNQIKSLTYQASKMGAILQKQVASKTYARLQKQRKTKATYAINYFAILSALETNKAHIHHFYQGETSFVIGDYERSLQYYDQSFDQAVKNKDATYMERSMDGILSSLGQKKLDKKIKENNYIAVYEKYLKNYPTGKIAKSIYQKLFKVYFDRGLYEQAKSTLDRFNKYYASDWKTQEAMIALLMEKSRKKKENALIRNWISDIDAGKYKVSKRYANKLRELLTTLQIEDVQMELKKGNKKEALVGYHKILQDPHSTQRSKINAKYNLAALYYEMGATTNAFEWSQKALDEMTAKDTENFSDSFLTISSFLFMRLEFIKSAILSQRIVEKLCTSKSRKKAIAFKNSAYLYLAEKDLERVERMISLGERCQVPENYIDNVRFELLHDYQKNKAWSKFELQLNALATNKKNWAKLIVPVFTLEKVQRQFGNNAKANSLRKKKWAYYNYSKKAKVDIPLEALDMVALTKIISLERLKNNVLNTQLQFPFVVFQKRAFYIRETLDKMILEANQIQKIGSGNGIVKAYAILIEAHEKLAKKFLDFKPEKLTDVEKQNISTFYKQMKMQSDELLKTARTLKTDVWSTIDQNQILSSANNEILPAHLEIAVRYWYPQQAILMDRGGKK